MDFVHLIKICVFTHIYCGNRLTCRLDTAKNPYTIVNFKSVLKVQYLVVGYVYIYNYVLRPLICVRGL